MMKHATRRTTHVGVCLTVLVLLGGCGGSAGKHYLTRGGWLCSNGRDALIIGGDSTYLQYSVNGYWETGDLTLANGDYTFAVTAAQNGTGVGTSRSGAYTVSETGLRLVPASGSPTDWARMPDGGTVPSAIVGTWSGFGQYLRFYASGHFYYYDVTTLSLGTCSLSGGNFTFQYRASDHPTLIGTTLTGTYSVVGNNCTWTPQGRSPVTLTRQP